MIIWKFELRLTNPTTQAIATLLSFEVSKLFFSLRSGEKHRLPSYF